MSNSLKENFICEGTLIRDNNTTLGLQQMEGQAALLLKGDARIRSGTIIYADSQFGNDFQTGHNVMIREKSKIGNHVLVGTGTVVDGQVDLGNFIKIESNCYICTHVKIGNQCFIGPNVVFTNDRLPLRQRDQYIPVGPVLEDNVTIGGGVVLCPGVKIGAGSFVAAGSVVTKDVPPRHLAKGNPARFEPLPPMLDEPNMALSWRKYQDPETGELPN